MQTNITVLLLGMLLSVLRECTAAGAKTGGACFDYPLTVSCEALKGVHTGTIDDVEWKVYDPKNNQWTRFGYCNKFMNCIVVTALLPNGIQVLNIVNGTLTIQASPKNIASGQSRLLCQVHFGHTFVNNHEVNVSFTACIKTHITDEAVNLTKILQRIVSWERVTDIELFDIKGSKFAYCNTGACIKVNDSSHSVPVFWSRLEVRRGSLFLTGITEADDGLTMRAKVHLKTESIETVRLYTLKIFVNTSQGSQLTSSRTTVAPTDSLSSSPSPANPAGSPKSSSDSAANELERKLLAVLIPIAFILGALLGLFAGIKINCENRVGTHNGSDGESNMPGGNQSPENDINSTMSLVCNV